MLNFGGIFAVVLAALGMVMAKTGTPLQNRDIEDLLKFLKEQQSENESELTVESPTSDLNSGEGSVNSIYGLLKNMEVIDLIEKANLGKSTSNSIKRNKNRIGKHTLKPVYRNYEINRHKDSTQQILEQLLKDKDTAHLKKQRHHRLTPNKLIGSTTLQDDDKQEDTDDDNGSNEYSKLFVILNTDEIQKSKSKANLANLVSRILSLSSASNEKARLERNKSHLYKGFKVKNDLFSRRYRRESKENSAEDDFKPKRSRNDHNGGSGGGRTAIPYIRQRGDIYERDH